ncbi:CoA pyrophosphatase [Vibrio sp. S4M6]|uniref:CoA pyrophosphatase n=1 Tax=Vibrio sinus TaxID=2946865 RepID=UPI002029C7EE|nr:CoA pyrophosphatase [Vibrio sinus]MCL9781156.1 CoA pyrophosphatase [Vibrio sinus]
MLSHVNKNLIIRNFQFNQPVGYDVLSTKRVSHLKGKNLRKASVLIGFVERPKGLHIVLTRRAKHLKHHPGQVSFPGGKFEESDASLKETAIREANEEIGLNPSLVNVIGQMPELITVSHFSVTPVIAIVDPSYSVLMDKNEVDEVFEVPANHILDREKMFSHTFRVNKQDHRVYAIPYKTHFIWGMTAQIIQAMQKQLMH